jgi:hypothetical protein
MPEQSLDWAEQQPYSAQSRLDGTKPFENTQIRSSFVLTEGEM